MGIQLENFTSDGHKKSHKKCYRHCNTCLHQPPNPSDWGQNFIMAHTSSRNKNTPIVNFVKLTNTLRHKDAKYDLDDQLQTVGTPNQRTKP